MNHHWTKSAWLCAAIATLGACADQAGTDERSEPAAQVGAAPASGPATWTTAGNGIDNTRSQPHERILDPEAATKLAPAWVYEARGDIWATPAVDETTIYVPDGSGYLSAIDRDTHEERWARPVSEYTGHANDFARVTPAVTGDALYLGNQLGRSQDVGATVFAVDKRTGAKLWSTKVEEHPVAIITSSPVVYGDTVYVGVSSYEEFRAPGPYVCCSFRGSMVALDRKTGKVLWKRYMTPGDEAPGYTGVGIWGSTPVVDPKRKSLYVATGNNYSVPTAVLDCMALPADQVDQCIAEVPGAEDNLFDSVVALELDTGKVKWVHRAARFDAFNGACIMPNSPECRKPNGPDFDFGQGPILYSTVVDGKSRELLGAGQKSGVFWALDPDDGSVVWQTQVGPGGIFGGLEWGSASDGKRIYTAVANSGGQPWTLPSGEVTRTGLWSALDAATGKIVWQTRGTPAVLSSTRGAVSTANGVVYGGTYDGSGTMYAFDAATGKTLWTHVSGGTVATAPAIVDGTVLWAAGYATGGGRVKKLWAFAPSEGSTPSTPDASTPPVPVVPAAGTWRAIHASYFGPGSVGQCVNCHAEMGAPDTAYEFLSAKGQIDGTRSKLAGTGSVLTWFGGTMPPLGPTSYPEAERDLKAWVAAGANED